MCGAGCEGDEVYGWSWRGEEGLLYKALVKERMCTRYVMGCWFIRKLEKKVITKELELTVLYFM